jgi:hypothetical protein
MWQFGHCTPRYEALNAPSPPMLSNPPECNESSLTGKTVLALFFTPKIQICIYYRMQYFPEGEGIKSSLGSSLDACISEGTYYHRSIHWLILCKILLFRDLVLRIFLKLLDI